MFYWTNFNRNHAFALISTQILTIIIDEFQIKMKPKQYTSVFVCKDYKETNYDIENQTYVPILTDKNNAPVNRLNSSLVIKPNLFERKFRRLIIN